MKLKCEKALKLTSKTNESINYSVKIPGIFSLDLVTAGLPNLFSHSQGYLSLKGLGPHT